MLGSAGPFVDGAWYVACEAATDGGDNGDGYNYHGIVQYSADTHSMWSEDGEQEYSLGSADGWVKQS